MSLFDPWIFLRLVLAFTTTALFWRAAFPALKVLRHFDLRNASEGQLALERTLLLSTTLLRVALVLQGAGLLLAVLSATKLAPEIRGAMCAYGVLSSNAWGFPSMASSFAMAALSGMALQLVSFDATQKRILLARPLAITLLAFAPLSLVDLALCVQFARKLDLTVIASCCSVELDAGAADARSSAFASHGQTLSLLPPGLMMTAALSAFLSWRRPSRRNASFALAVSLLALPISLGYIVLEVAPHVFETPTHMCPFCLLKKDANYIGYPLFLSVYFATVWALGAYVSQRIRGDSADEATSHAARLARSQAVAWTAAFVLSVAPIVRYAWLSGGRSLWL